MSVAPEPAERAPLATESRWSFYRSLFLRYWRPFVGMMLLVVVYSGITAGRLGLAGFVVKIVEVKFGQAPNASFQRAAGWIGQLFGLDVSQVIDRLRNDNQVFLYVLAGSLALFIVAAVIMAIAFFFKECLGQSLIVRMEVDIRESVFEHLSRQSVAYFNKQRSGDVISRLTNDVNALRSSFKLFFEDIVQQPFMVIFALIVAYLASPLLFILTVPFYGILMLPVIRAGRKVIKHGRGRLEKLSIVTEAIQQLFTGIRVVKAFGMERQEVREFRLKNEAFVRSTLKLYRAKVKGRSLQELLYNAGTGAAVLLGVWMITAGVVGIAEFGVFMMCMVQIYMPLKALSNAWNQLQESRAGSERLLEILRQKPSIVDHDGSEAFPGLRESLALSGVSFSYGELDSDPERAVDEELRLPVLHDISFSARAGEVVALVGPSGSGKSTIADLIARFYDPQHGAILVDGRNIREYRFASYLEAIAIVSQDPFLFNATIRENIRYGRSTATDEEVEQAAKAAFAHDFILEQPEGYDTVIGERGVKLSGGQRQRLTIARAVLKNAPILILDEATSALDSQSEKEVQHAIDNLIKSRTTFVIAHRLSTIQSADQILVLDEGRIVERGRHDELLAQHGRYHRLWTSQVAASQDATEGVESDATARR